MKLRRLAPIFVLATSFVGFAGSRALAQAQDTDTSPSEGEGDNAQPLPAGHPSAAAGRASKDDSPDMFRPPADVEEMDPSLPAGTIAVDLHDADDKPVSGETVNLGILINSIAKGDTHKHKELVSDDRGRAVFAGLETLSNIAYRVSVGYQGGSFAATPFQIPEGKALHVVLHVYPVTRDLAKAVIACQVAIEAEPRDDRMQLEEAVTIYNLGRTAWQPEDVRMALPAGYTAFGAQQSMSDQGIDEDQGSAKLRGTFPPGEHSLELHWQLPMSGDKDVDFEVGVPPHTAMARLLVPGAPGVHLYAPDFPPPQLLKDSRGQSFLVTERNIRFDGPRIRSISMGVHDLPTPGPGRLVATGIAGMGVLVGLYLALSRRDRRDRGPSPEVLTKHLQTSLLEEIVAMEKARASGAIGPKTYERARRELIDALALTVERRANLRGPALGKI